MFQLTVARMPRKFALVTLCLVIAAGVIATVVAQELSARKKLKILALQERCVQAMIAQTCSVTNGSNAVDISTSVFVAGTGPINLQVYKVLKASGSQMCSQVHTSCEIAWEGATCRVARALYPDD